jgi:predicted Zn-dependent protease
MTRDGVYMIENGELTHAVKNLRYTQSYVDALANVAAVGNVGYLLGNRYAGTSSRVPALKIKGWNFTGSTA